MAKKKVTLYFSGLMLEETQREAVRQDRSISWIVQTAWRLAKDDLRGLPAAPSIQPSVSAPAVPSTPSKQRITPQRSRRAI